MSGDCDLLAPGRYHVTTLVHKSEAKKKLPTIFPVFGLCSDNTEKESSRKIGGFLNVELSPVTFQVFVYFWRK